MVHDREAEHRRIARCGPHDLLVRAPGASRNDPRRPRGCDRPQRNSRRRAADEPCAHSSYVSARPHFQSCRPGGPPRVAEVPAGARVLGQAAVGAILRLGSGRLPRAPLARRPGAQLNTAAAAPVHADEVERPVRLEGCRRPVSLERQVTAPERRIGGVRGRRGREEKGCCDQESSHQSYLRPSSRSA